MTFKEKYLQDHPDDSERIDSVIHMYCPDDFGYEEYQGCCSVTIEGSDRCIKCWDREMPGTENKKESNNMRKTKAELEQELMDIRKELESVKRIDNYKDAACELKACMDALIEQGFTREEAMTVIIAAATKR